jgi:arsenite methyltransferase
MYFLISDISSNATLLLHYNVMCIVLLVYAGCISGAMQMEDYLALVPQAGFVKIAIQKKKPIIVPHDLFLRHLTAEQLQEFNASGTGIFSITVYAEKPAV